MKMPMPSPSKTYRLEFPKLTGGLNTEELEYRLKPNESPFMKNMWWQDGVLQCRDGQVSLSELNDIGYACFERTWHGYIVVHVGTEILAGKPAQGMKFTTLRTNVPEIKGTFFRYFDWLFYKTKGEFYKITFNPVNDSLKCENVTESAYMPIIQINSDPDTGAGDLYQPENRLTQYKKVWFTAKPGVTVYHLPVKEVSHIPQVKIDGEFVDSINYLVDEPAGTVTFKKPPAVSDPPVPNTVEITFAKFDEDSKNASKAIMDCRYAFVAGGDRNICILLAGSDAQPNAVFWNANDDLSMNASYWPFDAYNLVGPTNDPVSGFGAQYKDTIVFKEHSVGKLDFTIDEIDKRKIPLFTYTQINDKTGCDLPWTIQLVENNLVFCNTYQGVHLLRSSSSAYENNVVCISRKVNDPNTTSDVDHQLPGLLREVQEKKTAGFADTITSNDDDTRYWLCVGCNAYVWDYTISDPKDPSWFLMDTICPAGWMSDDNHTQYYLHLAGNIVELARTYTDYGQPINKVYQFPITDFGEVERLKDVTDLYLVIRSDTESVTEITYRTNLETRNDLTNTRAWDFGGVWTGMNLAKSILGMYNLTATRYGQVVRRRPMCRHIEYFSTELRNNNPGQNMGIVSARFLYKLSGKER